MLQISSRDINFSEMTYQQFVLQKISTMNHFHVILFPIPHAIVTF